MRRFSLDYSGIDGECCKNCAVHSVVKATMLRMRQELLEDMGKIKHCPPWRKRVPWASANVNGFLLIPTCTALSPTIAARIVRGISRSTNQVAVSDV